MLPNWNKLNILLSQPFFHWLAFVGEYKKMKTVHMAKLLWIWSYFLYTLGSCDRFETFATVTYFVLQLLRRFWQILQLLRRLQFFAIWFLWRNWPPTDLKNLATVSTIVFAFRILAVCDSSALINCLYFFLLYSYVAF